MRLETRPKCTRPAAKPPRQNEACTVVSGDQWRSSFSAPRNIARQRNAGLKVDYLNTAFNVGAVLALMIMTAMN
ncbi:hypothetical protein EV696_11853 [Permianibacter aggregans]|uniref:Uncharacterized protein n=1 Tax=Permianibacter aggregans TaxID=1510150 RepID=A0A4R6UH81_9GAMM|nr:hypothetical protein EV696_11853 [Permianibacter aggregans]